MTTVKRIPWVAHVLLPVLGLARFAACAAATPPYTVHVVEPAVTDHVILPDGPLPPVCRAGDTLRLRACRGEYESASFVVTANEPLEAVRVDVAPVTGPDGADDAWPEDAVDVRVVKPFVREIFGDGRFVPIPTLLVHDETWLAIEPAPTEKGPGHLTNVLKGERRDAAELQPVTIEQRKRFWVTVRVPERAAPGTYRTTLRIAPRNAEAATLTLEIEVYPFELLAPMLEYSIYYPTLLDPDSNVDYPQRHRLVNEAQYLADHENMAAHGVRNPVLSGGHGWNEDGTANWHHFKRMLDMRESVGIRPGHLYMASVPVTFQDRPLTPEELDANRLHIAQMRDITRPRGYEELFFMAGDEWHGDKLSRERDSMVAVHEEGASVVVAVMDQLFFDLVGDVLDRPVLKIWPAVMGISTPPRTAAKQYEGTEALRRMPEFAATVDLDRLVSGTPEYRKAIDGVHALGKKIYTYMNPVGGTPMPAFHRLYQGLALWRIGYDGSMTWAYTDMQGDRVNQPMIFSMVYRTDDGVVDTLHWEGVREGIDDVRYLTTLYDALARVAGRFPSEPLIATTHAWLADLDVAGGDVPGGDLDAIRHEMARRIVELQRLGHRTPEELLRGVNVEKVRVTRLPETWRFRPDTDDAGVAQRWFASGADIAAWSPIRTDVEKGWDGQGFADAKIGHGWYRTTLPPTEAGADVKHAYLFFEAVDEQAWIYVNGQSVGEHTIASAGLQIESLWNRPFSVALNDVPTTGGEALAVRVHNNTGMGGVWKPVHVVLSPQPLSPEQITAIMRRRAHEAPAD